MWERCGPLTSAKEEKKSHPSLFGALEVLLSDQKGWKAAHDITSNITAP